MAIPCRQCEEMLLDRLYGELNERDSAEVARHLESCPACASRERAYRETMRALDLLKGDAAPAGSVLGARAALEREMLLSGAGKSREPRRYVGYVLAAAAALLAVVGVSWYVLTSGPGIGAPAYGEVAVEQTGYEVTVFNDDLALVKDKRHIVNLAMGANVVKFADVAAMIDPTSVRFESTTDPLTTKVTEQNYEFDLASPEALLKRFVDRKIACVTKDGKIVEGCLASFRAPAGSPGTIVLTAEPGKGETSVVSVDDLDSVRLGEMPKGLLVKPTLVWKLDTQRPGPHDTNLIYQTSGFSWNADYVVTVGKDDVLDWFGWVTISNNSGTSYPGAKLKLIAGEVHRVQEAHVGIDGLENFATGTAATETTIRGKAFEEKSFFEYHLYTLDGKTSLNNAETKQLKLMKAEGVPSTRRYVFDADRNASNALVELEVWNKKENHLGLPLPKGNVRFRQADPDGDLEYVGRDSIEHASKDEKLTLNIGASFDVAGGRILRRESSGSRQRTQSFVITLRNHKPAPVKVTVREHPNAGQPWAVTVKSQEFNKLDQGTVEFPVEVPANGEATVSYTIRYTW